jgi:hypothetical protein
MEDYDLEESETYWETAMLYGIAGVNDCYDLEPPSDDREGY